MKKPVVIFVTILMLCSIAGCGKKQEEAQTAGGWALTDDVSVTAEAQGAFDKALEGLTGVGYTPVALLGTQLVSGTNYSFLCEAAVVYPDAQPYYALVYVYENLEGDAEVLNIVPLNIGDIAESGEIKAAETGSEQLLGGWTVDRETSVEADDAVMHLATQIVAGKNHCVLCKGWTLAFIYEDLDGKTEVTQSVPLDIAALSQPAE